MNQRALLGIIAALLLIVGLLIGFLVGGGGGSDSDDTATGAADSSTATAAPAETTIAPPTTEASTTSTTTTTTTTTTTMAPATGVIAAAEGVVGSVADGVWVPVAEGLDAVAGDEYRIVMDGSITNTIAGPAPEPGCFGETPYVDLGFMSDDWPFRFPIGVSGAWDLFPQPVEVLATDNPTYVETTRELMASYGIDDLAPELLQVLRVDLEGDGVDEVIVVAQRLQSDELIGAVEGDYGIAYLRKVVEGEVQTAILGRSQVDALGEGEFGFVEVWRVPAIADLNGDGQMEIVTQGFYYEGSWTEVWEYINDDLGPVAVLTVGCGV